MQNCFQFMIMKTSFMYILEMKTGWDVNETEVKLVHFKLISVVTTTELLITWRDNNRRSKMLVTRKESGVLLIETEKYPLIHLWLSSSSYLMATWLLPFTTGVIEGTYSKKLFCLHIFDSRISQWNTVSSKWHSDTSQDVCWHIRNVM